MGREEKERKDGKEGREKGMVWSSKGTGRREVRGWEEGKEKGRVEGKEERKGGKDGKKMKGWLWKETLFF